MKQEDFKRILDKFEPNEVMKDKILSSKRSGNQLRKRLITVAASFALLLLTSATVLAAVNYLDLVKLFRSTFDDNVTAENIEEGRIQKLDLTQANGELSLTLNSFTGDSETHIVLFEMEYLGKITSPIERITLSGKTMNVNVSEEEKTNYAVTKFEAFEVTYDENTRKIYGKYILPPFWVGDTNEDVVIDIIGVEILCEYPSQRIQIDTDFEYTFTPDRSILKAALTIPIDTDISKDGEVLTIDEVIFSQYKTEINFSFFNSAYTRQEAKALCERFTYDFYYENSFKWIKNDCYVQLYADGIEVKTKDLSEDYYPGQDDMEMRFYWSMIFQPTDYCNAQNIEIQFGDVVIPVEIPIEIKNANQTSSGSGNDEKSITAEEEADLITIDNDKEAEEVVFNGLVSDKQTPLLGNSSSLNVGGFICTVGDTVYYSNDKDQGYLYKLDTDGTKSKIYEAPVRNINVMGGFVYFMNDYNHYICRVDLNGDNYKVISTDSAAKLILTQDQIFYTGKNNYLYMMDLEGKQITQLTNHPDAWWMNVYKDYLIYSGLYDNFAVYCYDLTSNKEYKILDYGFCPVVFGDYLYYQTEEGVTQCNLTDGSKTVLTEKWGQQFAVVQDAVYYIDSMTIWKYPLDGSTPPEIILTSINKDDPDQWKYLDIKINWICAGTSDVFFNITEDGADKLLIYHTDTGVMEEF